jgi:hypothetical protein
MHDCITGFPLPNNKYKSDPCISIHLSFIQQIATSQPGEHCPRSPTRSRENLGMIDCPQSAYSTLGSLKRLEHRAMI